MFYGVKVSQSKSVAVSGEEGKVLHLSQACLDNPTGNGKVYLYVEHDGKKFACCCLQKDKNEHASLDLFVNTENDVTISVKGGEEVSVVGYFEPDAMSDDEEGADFMGSAEMSEAEEEDEVPGKKGREDDAATATPASERSDDDDDDMPGDSDEEEGDDEDSEEEEAPPPPPAPKAKAKAKAKAKPAPVAAAAPGKRKAEEQLQKPQAKQQKATGSEAAYEKSLKEALKTHGKMTFSSLGGKVKKPEDVSSKLGQFIKDRPNTFKVDNGNVTLVK